MQQENELFVNVPSPESGISGLPARMAILVLGMHRSGTSSLAGALVRLGGAPPARLMEADSTNERGFWESQNLADLNDEILAAAGSDWADWRRFDIERISAETRTVLRVRASETLRAEFGSGPNPVIKDPRMCRLMDFWAPALAEMGWSTRAVIPVRSPLEVAWSLERRNSMDPGVGCLIWLRHVLDAETATRGQPRALLDWSDFLGDARAALGRVATTLGVTWPNATDDGLEAVESFLSNSLRHFTASPAEIWVHPAISDLAREAYRLLLSLAEDPGDPKAMSGLDAVRERFEQAAAVFDPAMRSLENTARRLRREAAEAQSLRKQIAEFEAERRRLDERLQAQEAQLRALETRAEALVADLAGRYAKQCRTEQPRRIWRRETNEAVEWIRASAFFDPAYYLAANPDVGATGDDPALHYLTQGAQQGRDPGPHFSTRAYLLQNPDVAAEGLNPLLHYETRGRTERRPVLRRPPAEGPVTSGR